MKGKTQAISICFIAPKAWPLFDPACNQVFGGAEVDLYLLAKELAREDCFNVSFLVSNYGQAKTNCIDRITVVNAFDFKDGPILAALSLWRSMKKINAEIYFQEAASAGTFLISLFCRFHRKKFVYRTANQGECDKTFFRKNRFTGFLFSQALKWANSVITQSEIDKQNLTKHYNTQAEVIRNAQMMPPEPVSVSSRSHILWVGRSTPLKRPDLFLKLANQVPEQQFVMICQKATGDTEYVELKTEAQKIRNLRFIERAGFNEIETYFENARVFVNTSDSEGFPNTFVHAAKCSVPILSLNVDPDDFLERNDCGKGCKGNFSELVNSLKIFCAPSKSAQLGANARRYALQNHDIEKIAKTYKCLFETMCRGDSLCAV